MTLIEILSQQVEDLLYKYKTLASENNRLKQQLHKLETVDETIVKLETTIEEQELEKKEKEKKLEALTLRLEKLLV